MTHEATSPIEWTKTLYRCRDGLERLAVAVSWLEIERVCGHKHEGTPDDDSTIIEHLLANGAPRWICDASGEVDDTFWYLVNT